MNKRVGLLMVALIATLTSCSFSGKGNISKIYDEVKNKEVSFKSENFDKIEVYPGVGSSKCLIISGINKYYYFGVSWEYEYTLYINDKYNDIAYIYYSKDGNYSSDRSEHHYLETYVKTGGFPSSGLSSSEEETFLDLLNDVNSYWTTTYGYGIR